MKAPRPWSAILGLTLAVFSAGADAAYAAEVTVWTARAPATVLAEVGPEFERQTGHSLSITSDLSPAFVRRAKAGEPFDAMITGSVPLAGLVTEGRIGSGIHVARMLERLGIADAIRGKVVRPESDIVSELVAKGEVELGMVVITQIVTTPGVHLVGPLPAELQSYVEFDAGVGATALVSSRPRVWISSIAPAERHRGDRRCASNGQPSRRIPNERAHRR